jgi:exodeoxyribonuclease VII small subunit
MPEEAADLSFEEAVARLEAVVAELEGGSLPLEECLRRFEQAVALARHCSARLEAAERQISILTEEGGLRSLPGLPWEREEAGEEDPPDLLP